MLEEYGVIGKAIRTYIDEAAQEIISEIIQPVRMLPPELENKTVFNLDDLCLILGYEAKNKQKIREACQRGEIPFQQIGRDYIFPKAKIVEFLLGNWRKKEKKNEEVPKPLSRHERGILNLIK